MGEFLLLLVGFLIGSLAWIVIYNHEGIFGLKGDVDDHSSSLAMDEFQVWFKELGADDVMVDLDGNWVLMENGHNVAKIERLTGGWLPS